MLDWRFRWIKLRTFIAAADEGSFSAAGRRPEGGAAVRGEPGPWPNLEGATRGEAVRSQHPAFRS